MAAKACHVLTRYARQLLALGAHWPLRRGMESSKDGPDAEDATEAILMVVLGLSRDELAGNFGVATDAHHRWSLLPIAHLAEILAPILEVVLVPKTILTDSADKACIVVFLSFGDDIVVFDSLTTAWTELCMAGIVARLAEAIAILDEVLATSETALALYARKATGMELLSVSSDSIAEDWRVAKATDWC